MAQLWLNSPLLGGRWPHRDGIFSPCGAMVTVMTGFANQTPNKGLSRRALLGGGLALAAVAPARVFAQSAGLTDYERRLVEVAMRERDRVGAMLMDASVVAIADFARPSHDTRMHFVDMAAGRVRSHLVAHGRGSDPEHVGVLRQFSNHVGSYATSRGAYLTTERYAGKYGTSMRLRGLDLDNSNAYDRAIVMHPAWYAAPDMVAKFGKLGRSEGCFAMAPDEFAIALDHLGSGRLLFADRIGEA
jgi:hypothetical protein